MKNKTLIIAEIGINHNGSIDLAIKMIKEAKKIGADAVKFQTAIPNLVISKKTLKAKYQMERKNDKETQLEMAEKIHLPLTNYKVLKKICDKIGIIFISSPFDIPSIDKLIQIKTKYIKIPSGEITNLPYLNHLGKFNKKLILSTGMSTLKEIKWALNLLIKSGTNKKNITILQCNSDYPTNFNDVNLLAMAEIKEYFKINIGYSDHTLGTDVPIAAVSLGAKIIEKHFTLNKKLPGPDNKISMEPQEFSSMIKSIRNVELSLGTKIKKPTKSEFKNIRIVRKSIVAKNKIKKGELFSYKNITTKRPGNGISPIKWNSYIGKKSKKNYKIDDKINE